MAGANCQIEQYANDELVYVRDFQRDSLWNCNERKTLTRTLQEILKVLHLWHLPLLFTQSYQLSWSSTDLNASDWTCVSRSSNSSNYTALCNIQQWRLLCVCRPEQTGFFTAFLIACWSGSRGGYSPQKMNIHFSVNCTFCETYRSWIMPAVDMEVIS